MSLQFCANLGFLFKEVSFLDRYGAASKAGLLSWLLFYDLITQLRTIVVGFSGVECGADIYQYEIEDLKVARETAAVEQIHINAPTGNHLHNNLIILMM